ncbi:MAG TPA: hypothetical protein DD435_17180 [Cyanobacteria bacterium UBA8530]|nr:hypothetical protein [Cyanobacteria bacterium UBA8530]
MSGNSSEPKRRSAIEMLAALKKKRQDLEEKARERLAQYDARIIAMENRYNVEISLDEMRDFYSIEEMEEKLRKLREREKNLRRALELCQ